MRCCVSHCLNTSDNVSTSEGKGRVKQEAISFHGFPKNAHLRAAWLKALGIQESQLIDSAVVCSQHFLHDDVCETESGTKLLRRGAVPSTVQVCMMCLDIDSKMFLMRKHKFDDAYEKLTGHPLWDGGNLKQTICMQCTQRLRNFSRFRELSLRARSLMMELLEKHEFITINHIRTIKRKLNNNFSYNYDLYKGEAKKEKFDDDADKGEVKSELSDDSMWEFDDDGDDMDTCEEADGEVFVELTPTRTKYDPLSKSTMKNENEEDDTLIKTESQTEANNDELEKKSSENENKAIKHCIVEVEHVQDGETVEPINSFDNQNLENASKDKDNEENDPDISETLQELYNQSIEAKNEATFHWESDFSDCTLSSISWVDEVYTCDICQKTFRERKRLTQHIKTHSLTNDKSLSCKLCDYKFRFKCHLENHMRTHASEKLYSCTICSKEFSLKCSLSRHLKSHKEKHITCQYCAYRTSRRDHLLNHMKTHTGETRYACKLCTYKCFHNSDLVKHMRTHTGEKPFPCEFCGRKFAKSNTLTRHTLRLHTRPGEIPFTCSICDYKCYYQSMFIKHTKTHATNQTYSCRLCEYTCHSETQFKRHTKTHTTMKYYACEYCDFTVNFKSKLIRHIQTHTGERAFKCKTCNRAFLEKSKLTRHMKIHSDEKPFACTSCPFRCRRNSNLENHKKTHTRENRFSCELCPFKCARISALTKHMRTHK